MRLTGEHGKENPNSTGVPRTEFASVCIYNNSSQMPTRAILTKLFHSVADAYLSRVSQINMERRF